MRNLILALLLPAYGCAPGSEASGRVPAFERDIAPVLEARCASARGCHGDDPTPAVDLDLRSGRAYDALVNVPAETGGVPLLRVAAGDPDRSFLIDKLTGALGPAEGKRMPLETAAGQPVTCLSSPWIDAVLIRWIEAGAPRD